MPGAKYITSAPVCVQNRPSDRQSIGGAAGVERTSCLGLDQTSDNSIDGYTQRLYSPARPVNRDDATRGPVRRYEPGRRAVADPGHDRGDRLCGGAGRSHGPSGPLTAPHSTNPRSTRRPGVRASAGCTATPIVKACLGDRRDPGRWAVRSSGHSRVERGRRRRRPWALAQN